MTFAALVIIKYRALSEIELTTNQHIARYASSVLPTEWGEFRIVIYRRGSEEAVALIRDPIDPDVGPLARIHSQCLTGEVLGSLRCDCRAQLDAALTRIADEGGILVYLLQEGRGIGLGNKIRAYALQDDGADTVEANLALGFDADARSYALAAAILADLGIESLRLMTNNPEKVAALTSAGLAVAQEPHWVESSAVSRSYLETKVEKMGHIADLDVAIKKAK